MIIITGATGQFGRLVVEGLLARVPAEEIGVSVRDPEKAQEWAERGVRVRRGHFSDPTSLHHAFEGASQVLVVSVNSLGPSAVEQHGNAIAAAKAVGADHVLYTSHMAANLNSAFGPARDHAATEALLQSSGVPFTALTKRILRGIGSMVQQSQEDRHYCSARRRLGVLDIALRLSGSRSGSAHKPWKSEWDNAAFDEPGSAGLCRDRADCL